MKALFARCLRWAGIGTAVVCLLACPDPKVVQLTDTSPPQLNLVGDAVMSVNINDLFVDPGATATDDVDGDLTPYIDCDNPIISSAVGSYIITYNVCDFSGNQADEISRTVHVLDPDAPVITLAGESTLYVAADTVYTDAGAVAVDDVEGDISNRIVVVDTVDTATPGTYTITYNVSDTAGNPAPEVSRTVIVDGEAPVIALLGSSDLILEQYYQYNDAGATALDDVDGDLTAQIVVDNPLGTSGQAVGTHRITYNVTDRGGNSAVEVVRTVQIIDVTPPNISVASSDIFHIGDTFTPPAATASDNTNGDISHLVTVTGSVNTDVPGEYELIYNVSDTSGNETSAVCRVHVIVFSESYGRNGGRNDYGRDVLETPDGDFVLIGDSASSGVGRWDMWIVGTDAQGIKAWDAVYATNPHDYGRSVAMTPGGNVLALGYNGSANDIWLVELTTDGTEVSENQYKAENLSTMPTDMAVTAAGDIYITGSWTPVGETHSQALLMKIDDTGTQEWSLAYGGAEAESAEAILELSNGDFILAGSTYSTTTNRRDYIVWRVDADGNLQWEKSFGGAENETAVAIAETTDGAIVICGSTDSYGAGDTDAWILELDTDGNLNWSTVVGLSMDETAADVIPLPGGGSAFIGTRERSMAVGEDELWYVEMDGSGSIVIEREIGRRSDEERGESLIAVSNGNLVAVGTYRRGLMSGTSPDFWIIQF